jgi:Rrf2 family nitric oxide-sensitive transcriptional repressor
LLLYANSGIDDNQHIEYIFKAMRLSTFSDYCLRVLMYLGAHPERRATIAEIAAAHGISENHLMKVVHQLGRAGFIDTVRGKGGGMRLGRAPGDIGIGEVLRQTESDFALAECLGAGSACRIESACQLRTVLDEALAAMFLVLDGYTLADLLERPASTERAIQWMKAAG